MLKVSRYEYEKLRHEHLTEKQLEEELTARGSNYAAVRHHHNIHKVGIRLFGRAISFVGRLWRLELPSLWRMLG